MELLRLSHRGRPKTYTACEEWHRSFSELVEFTHPTMWKLLKALKTEQTRNDVVTEQHLAGQPVLQGHKKYRDATARIATIKSNQIKSNQIYLP